jgi:hypothetical protein
MTTRRLMLLVVLIARNASAAPEPSPRPAIAEGTVIVKTRTFDLGFGPVEGRAYFVKPTDTPDEPVIGPSSISLMVDAKDQDKWLERLDRLTVTHATVRVKGTWTEVNKHDFLLIKSIEELPR